MPNLPATMRYIDLPAQGAPEVMQLKTGPLPVPGEQDVLIRVSAAGVNRPDVAQRQGSYKPPPGASPVLGLEVAGEVVAVGASVDTWKAGDAVCALTPGGGYAEYCVAPALHCLPVPSGLSLTEAASLPENFFTVWVNVFDTCQLKAGDKFLVHGGSSGIGLTAIQLAKAFGAEVFTTVGNEEKAAFCKQMGADHVFNYKAEDWFAATQERAGKGGINVILDMVGGDYVAKNLKLLAIEGRLCQIAFLQGSKVELDLVMLMLKRQTLTGSTLRARPDQQKAAIALALRENVWPLIVAGRIKPVVKRIFALHEAAEAHRLMESSQHIGKIMLKVAD
ncbi:MAG: NAD(P)H-quinone oxidoreductase [Betaproteobacteria bacterium]|nr:NAD(P)H-quinone oxidoreductase [Betaproteobacteria bacterium]